MYTELTQEETEPVPLKLTTPRTPGIQHAPARSSAAHDVEILSRKPVPGSLTRLFF